jgi:hypothetical protein
VAVLAQEAVLPYHHLGPHLSVYFLGVAQLVETGPAPHCCFLIVQILVLHGGVPFAPHFALQFSTVVIVLAILVLVLLTVPVHLLHFSIVNFGNVIFHLFGSLGLPKLLKILKNRSPNMERSVGMVPIWRSRLHY